MKKESRREYFSADFGKTAVSMSVCEFRNSGCAQASSRAACQGGDWFSVPMWCVCVCVLHLANITSASSEIWLGEWRVSRSLGAEEWRFWLCVYLGAMKEKVLRVTSETHSCHDPSREIPSCETCDGPVQTDFWIYRGSVVWKVNLEPARFWKAVKVVFASFQCVPYEWSL